MNEILNTLCLAVFRAILSAATAILVHYTRTVFVPWLIDRGHYKQIRALVMAADKLAKTGKIPKVDKRKTVENGMARLNIPLNEKTNMYIEAAVTEVDLGEAKLLEIFTGAPLEGEEDEENSDTPAPDPALEE